MPLFGGQKKAGNHNHKKSSSSSSAATNYKPNNEHHMKTSNGTSRATPTLPPPLQPTTGPGEHQHWTHHQARPPPAPPISSIPSRQELTFHTQLAHGSATKEVKDFSNVKELYAKIAVAFDIPTTDVCCNDASVCLCVCL